MLGVKAIGEGDKYMNNKKTLGITGGLFLSIIVLLGSALFIGCSSDTGAFQENISYTGIDTLTMDASFFDVEVVSHSQPSVSGIINVPNRLKRRRVTVKQEQSGATLRITVEGRWRGGGFLSSETANIKINVPADTAIDIKTSSGSILVKSIDTEIIKVLSSSGKISVLECGAALTAKSSSGNIVIEDCAGSKDLDSSSGDIVVQDSDGDIEVESSSGKQTLTGIAGSIGAKSTSGKREISGVEGVLDLRSSSGNINGSTVTIDGDSSFQTTSGSIEIDFINDLDEFTMNLSSSSGKINAGQTKAKGTVVAGNGVIQITGKSSSGRQTYK